MDDLEIGGAIEREAWPHAAAGFDNDALRKLGAAARKVLAKPVATRDGVRDWYDEWACEENDHFGLTDICFAALSHFAPPARRMMIEGMAYTAIRDAMVDECAKAGGNLDEHDHEMTQWCARVAHRLATTPAPEVDPDAEAKRLAWLQWITAGGGSCKTPDELWSKFDSPSRNGWRAVAAAKKGAGGE